MSKKKPVAAKPEPEAEVPAPVEPLEPGAIYVVTDDDKDGIPLDLPAAAAALLLAANGRSLERMGRESRGKCSACGVDGCTEGCALGAYCARLTMPDDQS